MAPKILPDEKRANLIRDIQGLLKRMAKVICLVKSQFSHKLSFLCCFRSRISDKFIPFSIQVQHDQPKASKKVCASNVLSGPGRLLQANHCTDSDTLSKDPNWVFQFVKDKIIVVNRDESVQTAEFSPMIA